MSRSATGWTRLTMLFKMTLRVAFMSMSGVSAFVRIAVWALKMNWSTLFLTLLLPSWRPSPSNGLTMSGSLLSSVSSMISCIFALSTLFVMLNVVYCVSKSHDCMHASRKFTGSNESRRLTHMLWYSRSWRLHSIFIARSYSLRSSRNFTTSSRATLVNLGCTRDVTSTLPVMFALVFSARLAITVKS